MSSGVSLFFVVVRVCVSVFECAHMYIYIQIRNTHIHWVCVYMSWVFTGLLAVIISRASILSPSLFRSLSSLYLSLCLSLTDSTTAAFKLGKQIAFIHWCFSFSFSHFPFNTPLIPHCFHHSNHFFSFASICYHALFACGAAAYISPDNIFNRQQWYVYNVTLHVSK